MGDRRRRAPGATPLGEAAAAEIARALLAPARRAGATTSSSSTSTALGRLESQPQPGVPSELVEAACSFANGNPALLEQMVRICHEQGVIEGALARLRGRAGWRVHLGKLSTARLPMTVEDAVNVRLAALDHDGRQLLEQAATMGPVFWSGALFVLGRAGCQAPELWGRSRATRISTGSTPRCARWRPRLPAAS